jgi:hypothetical protein
MLIIFVVAGSAPTRFAQKSCGGNAGSGGAILEKRRVEARPKLRPVGMRCVRYMQINPLLVLETHFARKILKKPCLRSVQSI